MRLRKRGAWCSMLDVDGYDPRRPAGDAELQLWAEELSLQLEVSVLALFTWDGEASVSATRWRHGRRRAALELLRDAYRDEHGVARAPARVFWPWLPRETRAPLLRAGIALVKPAVGSTGDAELDALLEGFAEADDVPADFEDESEWRDEDDDDDVFVSEEISLAGIGAAIHLHPWLTPSDVDADVHELTFARPGAKVR